MLLSTLSYQSNVMRNEMVSNPDGSISVTNGVPQGVGILAIGKGQPPPYWTASAPAECGNGMELSGHDHCRKRRSGCGCMSWRERAILVSIIKSAMAVGWVAYLAIALMRTHTYTVPEDSDTHNAEKIKYWVIFTLIIVGAVQLFAWLLGVYGAAKRRLICVKICFITNAGIAIASFILFLATLSFQTRTLIYAALYYVIEAVCLFVVGKYYYDTIHHQHCRESIAPTWEQRI